MSRVKKYLKYQTSLVFFFAVFFIFSGHLLADSSSVMINEIQTAGESSSDDEFVELYNAASAPVDISDWSIQYKGGSGSIFYKKNFESGSMIPAKGYFLVAHGGNENYSGNIPYDMSWGQSFSSAGGTIFLVKSQELLVDSKSSSVADMVGYGMAKECETFPARNPNKGKSIERENFQDTNNNYADFDFSDVPTPSNVFMSENSMSEDDDGFGTTPPPDPMPEKKEYFQGIIISELFPNPFEAQYEEYIELYNGGTEDIDLKNWTLHDASKSGKYTFMENVMLGAKQYLAIFKKDFKFALNNSGHESVTLFDPYGREAAKIEYIGSKRDASYNFNGLRWRWSKFLTPASDNIFNNEPYGTIKVSKDVYKNVYADFSISVSDKDGDKIKVTWDFGDGHKSYLSKTRHKYLKTGEYTANVKLSDGSEDVIKNFKVQVKKYPHPEVHIIAIDANPKGSDMKNETITLANKSKKKINLKGWSVATGWKKLTNHPISEDFEIKPGKEKILTRLFSRFTLGNSKNKIELRYPDGKIAHYVKYKKEKGIKEGEVYEKTKGGWKWILKEIKGEVLPSRVAIQDASDKNAVNGRSNLGVSAESGIDNENTLRIISEETYGMQSKLEVINGLARISDATKIKFLSTSPHVLRAHAVREIDGRYFFISQVKRRDHYILVFMETVFLNINTALNFLFGRVSD